jgi:uncharacterized protein DUF4031
MTVYVDDASIPATVASGRARHISRWSHLFADTQEELHEFAARLGLRRSYFQPGRPQGDGTPSSFWHYDVTAGKRQQALRLGAQPVAWREAPQIMRARDAAAAAGRASHAAGVAYRAGDFLAAARLLGQAAAADPSRAAVWAGRTARVHAAMREENEADRGDPRRLREITADRLERAGFARGDPDLARVRAWNAGRLAAAQPEAEAHLARAAVARAEYLRRLREGSQKEAGQ